MKRFIIAILLVCFLVPYSEAQIWKRKRYELTFGVGPSQFFGDIGGYSKGKNLLGLKDISLSQTRFNANINIAYRNTQFVTTRLSLTYGSFHSTDSRGSNETRGFDAVTSFLEPALIEEYYFSKHKGERSYLLVKRGEGTFGDMLRALDFYVFAGVGGIYYNVKGNDLLLPRMGKPNGVAVIIPAGIGGTLIYTPNVNFGFEFGGRYSFSDNLDGFTSQYSKSNDVYYFLNFTLTYKLKTGARGFFSLR